MEAVPVSLDLLFETSWEVCNKVGGIYTVLSTKSRTLQELYKDKVIFIGPDVWTEENPSPYFKEMPSVLKEWKKNLELPYGIKVRVGRWQVPGTPIAVLVKFDGCYAVKDELYGRMWDLYKVDSLHAYGDYDEACAFSHAAAIVIESICKWHGTKDKNIIAHFDEWTTGMGLLLTKANMPEVATIFTTHATCIGRSICGNGKPLYDQMRNYNGDQMARELNMESKHSLEKAAAHNADCFTTVSDVTAVECEQLLEKRPDIVTPNGFEKDFVPGRTRFAAARRRARAKLLEVASSLTSKKFEDDTTFIVATSGRCEYRNKGIDVYLDSLEALRHQSEKANILAFVMVPAWVKGPREDLSACLNGLSAENGPLDTPWLSHFINNPGEDPINQRIANSSLARSFETSNLTVIYTPCYLDGADGIYEKAYYDLLIGMDATVFPSYYEPWGYTPLESIAFGVPTVTTSLSGFGQWILDSFNNQFSACGVNVIERNDSNYAGVVGSISESLRFLCEIGAAERQEISKKAMEASDKAAWSYFVSYYIEAFKDALQNNKNNI